jgi:formimidoylglutamate deiminase
VAAPVSVPAMVSAHSHAFQRDLRGAAERFDDDFWGWREAMYALAGALDPDAMYDVASRCYAEMRASGYGAVGEFHYVHHQPDGTPYADPNAMARAVLGAAEDAGLVIRLLPAAYARAGFGRPAEPGQRRFCDPDVETFLARVAELGHGVAAHSVRAVPADWLEAIARFSDERGVVRHVHAAEQPRELEECRAEHGCSPIELLDRTGFLGPLCSVVHGIHVSEADIALLARSGATVVSCPTTEGNLGDGFPPALAYRDAGVPLAVGTDENLVLDPFEEVRELETLARREGGRRDALLAHHGDLWAEVARAGAVSLGIEAPPPISVDRHHPRLRGISDADLPLALATCGTAAMVLA